MAPAARAAAESLACAVCATLPAPGKKLRSCERCKQRGLPATYYCSEACQEQGWPAHKAWHKEQKESVKKYVVEATNEETRATAKSAARHAERTGSKYSQLLAAALELEAEHDYRHAARKYREAIALQPLEPCAYYNLGVALNRAHDTAKAAQMCLRASELSKDGSEGWAEGHGSRLRRAAAAGVRRGSEAGLVARRCAQSPISACPGSGAELARARGNAGDRAERPDACVGGWAAHGRRAKGGR